MTEEMLAMTPYMMQIALNQTLQKIFKGKTYCGPGGEKELNFFEQKLIYIHNNPVRAGFVEFPENWIHSSARSWLLGEKGKVPISLDYAGL